MCRRCRRRVDLTERHAGGARAKAPPVCQQGLCNNPNSPSGQWNYLPAPEKLLGPDLLEDAICFCNKPGCREYILKKENKRKLKEAIFDGGVNDRCLPTCPTTTRSRRSRRSGA